MWRWTLLVIRLYLYLWYVTKGVTSVFSSSNSSYKDAVQSLNTEFLSKNSGMGFLIVQLPTFSRVSSSSLLLDPTLGISLPWGHWIVPFSTWGLKPTFLLFVPVLPVVPALREISGVKPGSHLVHVECSTSFRLNKSRVYRVQLFHFPQIAGPHLHPRHYEGLQWLFPNTEPGLHPKINPSWSWCIILYIYCWILFPSILLRVFISIFLKAPGLYLFTFLPACYCLCLVLMFHS